MPRLIWVFAGCTCHFVGFVVRRLTLFLNKSSITTSRCIFYCLLMPIWQHLEPWHDKTSKMNVRPAKTQISLGIHPVWSESSLSAWRKFGSLATHWEQSEDSDQTGQMPRLIRVSAGRSHFVGFVMMRFKYFTLGIARFWFMRCLVQLFLFRDSSGCCKL